MRQRDEVELVAELVEEIGSLMHGRGSEIQGAVLADLLAMWLAGHFADPPDKTATLREIMLTTHIEAVRELVEPNESIILERTRKGSS